MSFDSLILKIIKKILNFFKSFFKLVRQNPLFSSSLFLLLFEIYFFP